MRIKAAWLLLSLSSALCSRPALHRPRRHGRAEVASTPVPSPEDEQSYDAAEPAPGELNQGAADEGAGWDAAVEAAQAATPLIGEQQAKAVQRINDYFNNITNLQGNFEQVDANNKRTTGRFYVQRPGKLRFDYAPPSALRIIADGAFSRHRGLQPQDGREISDQSTPFNLLLDEAVDLAATRASSASRAMMARSPSRSRTRVARRRGRSGCSSSPAPELQLKQWMITDAQGFATTVTVNDVRLDVRSRPTSSPRPPRFNPSADLAPANTRF